MTAHPRLRIAIVEDHLMFREIIRKICTDDFGHEVVAEAADGNSALRLILGSSPDVVLLDISLPDMDGISVIEVLRKARSATRIIAITSAKGAYTLYRLERAGVDGFVDKGSNSLRDLREAIEAVGAGKRYFSAAFLKARKDRMANPFSFDKVLSDREREALSLIGLSLSDREIGARLKVAPKTAETFRTRLMHKLDLHSTPKLIRFAIENGFTQVCLPNDGGAAFP
jgi:DNA-binding NarL/FixJ family response regulator